LRSVWWSWQKCSAWTPNSNTTEFWSWRSRRFSG
jgi:hypothetical protein